MRPPRPKSRTQEGSGAPRPPFEYARDYQPPEDDYETAEVLPEPEPFTLRSEYVPTMQDLSTQIGAVGVQLVEVHTQVSHVRQELAQLTRYVISDHAPRITAVEKKTSTIAPLARGLGKWTAYVTLGLTVAAQVASAFRPDLVGPLQAVLNMFQGVQ
jgi:hypothetical protein